RFALSIDAVLRRAETVSKPLGPLLGEHPLFSAATIDNDGSVVLILDLPRLGQNYFARRGLHALVQAAPTASASPADAAGSGASTPAAAPAVLIVDDSLSVRKIAEKYATELGYQVETASDGLVALEKLQARRFALVLTDLEMPRMHGFELLAQIRGNEVTRALPVIVVTSRQAAKHRERADALGASDYLVKPFSKVQLGNKMADCLRASAAAAAAAAAS
ncbi:MAG: response regulator, partial [Verrucomicrobia bacterium]|nr:response regulator [Verrucomicrobiota bacterium]